MTCLLVGAELPAALWAGRGCLGAPCLFFAASFFFFEGWGGMGEAAVW